MCLRAKQYYAETMVQIRYHDLSVMKEGLSPAPLCPQLVRRPEGYVLWRLIYCDW